MSWSAIFQPTLPVRGATCSSCGNVIHTEDFNPRSPCGERQPPNRRDRGRNDFNPRSPCGARPVLNGLLFSGRLFQPTLPVGGATAGASGGCTVRRISTHAPRAGSDHAPHPAEYRGTYFNPRSPCGERLFQRHRQRGDSDFNPRSPCGERLWYDTAIIHKYGHFNPRSPCGERHLYTFAIF